MVKEKTKKAEKPIIDFGMLRSLHKNKMFAFLKGIVDSGVGISFDKNKDVDINEVTVGRNIKYWWFCLKCENFYEQPVSDKTSRNFKCPYCSGKKAYKSKCFWCCVN